MRVLHHIMDWTTWVPLFITLSVAGQWVAAMPSGSGHRKPPRLYGGSRFGYEHRKDFKRPHKYYYSSYYDPEYYRDECMSQSLTCVPEEDCVAETPGGYFEGRVCPINFVPYDSLCVLPALKNKVEPRTQAQVVDYCGALRTRPYYFQSGEEWREFYHFVIEHTADYYDLFMLDARWDSDRERWEWLSTGEEIEWEKLLQFTNCSESNKALVKQDIGCLGFSVDRKSECLRLRQIKCTDTALPFFCKDGSYNSRCGQNDHSLCCSSPTYSFYSKNKFGGAGSHNLQSQSRRECWIKLNFPNVEIVTCHKALDILGNLHPYPQPVRVGSSFYYFSRNPCKESREAVLSGVEVHDFIVSYLLTEELPVEELAFIFGLRYEPKDDEFFWVNGKRIDYYKNGTFWADGQPDKQSGTSKISCVGYQKSGKNYYAWHLLRPEQCVGPSVINICEMPIRSTKLMPTSKKIECGQRMERGVLARSLFRPGFHNDDEEALYGEFPWHVAVLRPSTHFDGVILDFACSGVLINPEYVLTSAHCVIYSGNGDFTVSLGEWDLENTDEQILDTKLVGVNDVIIHPKHQSTSLMHDVALLQLEEILDVDSYPHISLGCLPYPRELYLATQGWDCYTVGWPSTEHKESGQRILQRVESDFLPRSVCKYYTRNYYKSAKDDYEEGTGYDKKYGAHHNYYEHHGYFEDRIVHLLCTEPYESHSCLDDNTPILVCKRSSSVIEDPFSSSLYHDGPTHHYQDYHAPVEHYDHYEYHEPHHYDGPGKHYDYHGPGDHYDGYGHGDKYYGPGDHYDIYGPGGHYDSYGHGDHYDYDYGRDHYDYDYGRDHYDYDYGRDHYDGYGHDDHYDGYGPGDHHYDDDYKHGDKYYDHGDKHHDDGYVHGDKHYGPGDHHDDGYKHGDKHYDYEDHHDDGYKHGDKHYDHEDHHDDGYKHGDKHYDHADHHDDGYGQGDKHYDHGKDHYGGPSDGYKRSRGHHGHGGYGGHGSSYGSPHIDLMHLWDTPIVNPFGKDRFDSDKWFVIGIGHDLNDCDHYNSGKKGDHHKKSRYPHQVFTPVHKYLSFINQHLEPHVSAVPDDTHQEETYST